MLALSNCEALDNGLAELMTSEDVALVGFEVRGPFLVPPGTSGEERGNEMNRAALVKRYLDRRSPPCRFSTKRSDACPVALLVNPAKLAGCSGQRFRLSRGLVVGNAACLWVPSPAPCPEWLPSSCRDGRAGTDNMRRLRPEKIGWAADPRMSLLRQVAGDLQKLASSYPSMRAFTAVKRVVELQQAWAAMGRAGAARGEESKQKEQMGLSGLAERVLGKPLNKAMQVCVGGPSRWARGCNGHTGEANGAEMRAGDARRLLALEALKPDGRTVAGLRWCAFFLLPAVVQLGGSSAELPADGLCRHGRPRLRPNP